MKILISHIKEKRPVNAKTLWKKKKTKPWISLAVIKLFKFDTVSLMRYGLEQKQAKLRGDHTTSFP